MSSDPTHLVAPALLPISLLAAPCSSPTGLAPTTSIFHSVTHCLLRAAATWWRLAGGVPCTAGALQEVQNGASLPCCRLAPCSGALGWHCHASSCGWLLTGPFSLLAKACRLSSLHSAGSNPCEKQDGQPSACPQRGSAGTPKVCCKQPMLCEVMAARAQVGEPNQYAPCTFVQNVYVHDGSVSACRMRTCTMKLSTLWKAEQGAAPCSTPLRRWSRAHDGHTWGRCTAPLCRSSGSLQAAVACSWPA